MLDFDDLAQQEVPVRIGDARYVLKEASGDAATRYRTALVRGATLGPDGKPTSVPGAPEAELLLVSLTIFERTDKGDRAVPLPTVRTWAHRITRKLFEKAVELSGLVTEDTVESLEKQLAETQEKLAKLRNGQAEDHLGNSPGGTTAG